MSAGAAALPTTARAADLLFRQKCWFLGSVVRPDGMERRQPEVAFVGRSNVGKSSLINGLVHSRDLVKTAKRPVRKLNQNALVLTYGSQGHTTMLNFFSLADELTLVDMPGYGFGSRPGYRNLVEGFLSTRSNLKRICLLIDSRRGIMDSDKYIADFLNRQCAVAFQIVLTKADSVDAPELTRRIHDVDEFIQKNTAACNPHVFVVSSRLNLGLADLRTSLYEAAFPQAPTYHD